MWKWQTTVFVFQWPSAGPRFSCASSCLTALGRALLPCLLYLPERVHLVMLWLLTEHFVSPDLWWQMIDHESFKLVWLKWVWGEDGLLRPGPWSGKTESVHSSTSLPLGRSTNVWEGWCLGPQAGPVLRSHGPPVFLLPTLVWLTPAYTPGHLPEPPDQDAYLLGVFVKFGAQVLLCTYQNRLVIVYLLVCSQLDFGLLEGGSYVWFMLPFFVHSLIHKQREAFVEWVSMGSLFMLVTLLSGLSSGQMPKPFPLMT